MFMPFGKHRGQPLSEIPWDYLQWVLDNCDNLKPWLADAIEDEMERRQAQSRSHEAPRQPTGGTALVDVKGTIATWWRELVMKHHPDRGGDTRTMQVLNNAHERLKELCGVK